MNKVWLGIALITLTLSAFAHPINPRAGTNDTDAELQFVIQDESTDSASADAGTPAASGEGALNHDLAVSLN